MRRKAPSVVFRTNASSSIGMGHLNRCISIAEEMVTRGWMVSFVVRRAKREDPYGRLRSTVKHILELPAAMDKRKDLRSMTCLVSDTRPDLTIVDSYEVGEDYLKALQRAGSSTVFIDDLAKIRSGADLILNYNVGFGPKDYSKVKDARLLLGLKYCPLGKLVLSQRARMSRPFSQPAVAKELLVTLGASKHNRTFENILRTLGRLDWLKKVQVTSVRPSPRYDSRFSFKGYVKDLPALIQKTPLAITAGGSTCYQLACLGVPSLIYILAKNQQRIAEGLDASGLGVNLGPANPFNGEGLLETLSDLAQDQRMRERMAKTAFGAVDGLGARRIVDVMERMIA